MKENPNSWPDDFFIKNSNYWLYLMNQNWRYAPMQVRRIVKILKEFGINKGKVLELCCGNGRICVYLAKKGFNVTGIDISPQYIKDAETKAKRHKVKVHYICGDVRYLNKFIKEKFDVILSIWTSIGFYTKEADQKIIKMVANLLKRNGIFLVLQTMSREWILNHFCPAIWEEAGKYIILHKPDYDRFHSILSVNWRFYRKKSENLIFETELPVRLKIYSQHELTEMAENAGLKFVKAYDSIYTFQPARPDSNINMVFRK